VARMEPSYKLDERVPLSGSSLDWGDIHLIPTDRLRAQVAGPGAAPFCWSPLLPAGLILRPTSGSITATREKPIRRWVHVHRPKPDAKTPPLAPAGDFLREVLVLSRRGELRSAA